MNSTAIHSSRWQRWSTLAKAAALCATLAGAGLAQATPVELVVNGEFETPGIGANTCRQHLDLRGQRLGAGLEQQHRLP